MTWVLLMVAFAGPTSADKISYRGTFTSYEACERAATQPHSFWNGPDEHVCVPIGEKPHD